MKKKGRWLKWVNNSCRFDILMALHLLIFYDEKEKNLLLNNEGINILHDSIGSLLENPFSEERYNF